MSLLKVHITFDPAVTAADAALTTYKYNKFGAFCLQFDDGSHGILVADAVWDNYTYTDGCGNNRSYKGSVGMNSGTGVPGSNDYNSNVFNGPQLLDLIAKGHDIENHSYYHTGIAEVPPSPLTIQNDLISIMLEDDVINKYTAYKMTGFIVPVNFTGFEVGTQQLGYLTCISQGQAAFPADATVITSHIPTDSFNVPTFFMMTRFYYDNWQDNEYPLEVTMAFNQMITAQDYPAPDSRNIVCLFTHSLLGDDHLPSFTNLFYYLHGRAEDTIVFASLREVMEYTQMKNITLNRELVGNVLTVSIDEDEINHRQRWRDISLKITSDAAITGVTVEGFDSFSYNPATKLVNAFKQKTEWGTINPGPTPDPSQVIHVKHGNFIAQ